MFGVSSMSKIHYQKTLILNVFFEGIYFLGGRVRALTTTLSNVIGVSTLDFGSEKRPQRIQVSNFPREFTGSIQKTKFTVNVLPQKTIFVGRSVY